MRKRPSMRVKKHIRREYPNMRLNRASVRTKRERENKIKLKGQEYIA